MLQDKEFNNIHIELCIADINSQKWHDRVHISRSIENNKNIKTRSNKQEQKCSIVT